MKHVTTYVGIDAHKKDLFVAMLMGHGADVGTGRGGSMTDREDGG
jgi:hypothetical protein